jgi:hypothetical protein
LYCTDESSIIKIYYRIEDSTNLGTPTDVSTTTISTLASTNWISLNESSAKMRGVSAGNYNKDGNTVYKTTATPSQNSGDLSAIATVSINPLEPLRIGAEFPYALNSSIYAEKSANLKIYARIGFPINLATNVTGPTMGSVQAYLS